MKGHNIAVYIIIPLALFSIMSLFDNVQAQTNSTSSSANQTTSQSSANQTTSTTTTAKSKRKSHCAGFNENRYSCIKEYFDERTVSNS